MLKKASFYVMRGDDCCAFMVGLLHERSLYARQLCIAMRLAAKGGLKEAERFGDGQVPKDHSGHYSRHLKNVSELLFHGDTVDDLMEMSVPGHRKRDAERTVHEVPVMPAHEPAAEDMAEVDTARR